MNVDGDDHTPAAKISDIVACDAQCVHVYLRPETVDTTS